MHKIHRAFFISLVFFCSCTASSEYRTLNTFETKEGDFSLVEDVWGESFVTTPRGRFHELENEFTIIREHGGRIYLICENAAYIYIPKTTNTTGDRFDLVYTYQEGWHVSDWLNEYYYIVADGPYYDKARKFIGLLKPPGPTQNRYVWKFIKYSGEPAVLKYWGTSQGNPAVNLYFENGDKAVFEPGIAF